MRNSLLKWICLSVISITATLSILEVRHHNSVLAKTGKQTQTPGALLAIDSSGKAAGECPLKHTDVKAEVSGFLSRVTVTQEFQNPFADKIEAVYVFPLPQAAAVDDMTMQIGERVIKGKIMRRPEARATYEKAKQLGQVASLLDQERPDVFTQAVANILPGQQIKVIISYVETLKYDGGFYEWSFPMVVGERYTPAVASTQDATAATAESLNEASAGDSQSDVANKAPRSAERIEPVILPPGERTGHDISLEISIDAGVPIDVLSCKTHEIDAQQPDVSHAVVRLKDQATIPNKDFVLRYGVAGRQIEDAVLAHKSDKGGFFTLIVQPPLRVAAEDVTPKELVFVLDTSGSMGGFPIEKAKETMKLAMDNLYLADTFNLITFSGDEHILFPAPVPATPENLHVAQAFLESRQGEGSTEMMKAVKASMDPSDAQDHVRIVCFMTDGQVGNDMEIISEVQKHPKARVFAMGFGSAPNRFLLDNMAKYGRGEVEYVAENRSSAGVAKRFHERVRNPLLTDISVEWVGVVVKDVYPKLIPDLFSAKPVILSGRYEKGGKGILRLRGKMAGQDFVREIPVELPELDEKHDVLATLWARKKIEDLMSQDMISMQYGNVNNDQQKQITQLGIDYRLMTQFTSFVAVDEVQAVPGELRRVDVPRDAPAGPTATMTVQVTASASAIQTDTGERSDTLTSKQLDNLSIIGRSSLELMRILPGVVGPDPNDLEFNSFGGGSNASANYTANGIRGVNNNFSIDGSQVVDIGSNNGTIITANNDMVQEVNVKTSNYAAEYGSSAVQVNVTTKGGSRDFHGEGYDYLRPFALQASDRSNTIAGATKPNTSFNYPGGNIGGPLLLPFSNFNRSRDRLFFFGGFEVQRQTIDPGTRFGLVPTAAERAGDFSRSASIFGNAVFCPPSTFAFQTCSAAQQVANGNLLPFRSNVGSALLNLFPLPNFTAAPASAQARFNYRSAVTAPLNRTDLKFRFDYRVSNNTNVYLRLARETESDDSAYGLASSPSTFALPSQLLGNNVGRSAAINITSVISPTMTNEMLASGSKLNLNYAFADPNSVSKAALGLQTLQLPFGALALTPNAPLALFNQDAGSQLLGPGTVPLFAFTSRYAVTDTVSKVRGNHTLKFGGLVERAGRAQNLNGAPEGQIDFASSEARTTGNAFANLYTGRINAIDQTTNVPAGHFRFWNFEGFGQDSWKVKPNVTIEYGARLSLFTNNTETTGLAAVFDPRAYTTGEGPYIGGDLSRPNGILQARLGQIPNSGYRGNPGPLFGPRLNIAWDIFKDGSTVLHTGGGVFYNRVQGNYQYAMLTLPPNTLSLHADSWTALNNELTLDNLGNLNPASPGVACRVVGNCPSILSPDLNSNSVPRTTTASMSLARRLPFQNVLEVAYVGSFGRHLPERLALNYVLTPMLSGTFGNANLANAQQRAAIGSSNAALAALVPFPAYAGLGSGVQAEEFIGTSNYHALQVTLNRGIGKHLQYFFAYTFSKALGTTSTNENDGDASPNPIDIRGTSYGVLPYDRTHVFNFSYNYDLPKLARGSFANKFTRGLLNDWQMVGNATAQSGRPMRLKFSGAITSPSTLFSYLGYTASAGANAPTSSSIAPVLLRNPQAGDSTVNGSYLDLSAIALPAFGASGPYQSPFYIRSPATNNFDVTFFKNFAFTESKKLQFRFGLFNVFNEAFANPDLGDINLTLDTVNAWDPATINPITHVGTCYTIPAGTPTGVGTLATAICDPTKGFRFTDKLINSGEVSDTVHQFGRIVAKHGHRRIELALKFYF